MFKRVAVVAMMLALASVAVPVAAQEEVVLSGQGSGWEFWLTGDGPVQINVGAVVFDAVTPENPNPLRTWAVTATGGLLVSGMDFVVQVGDGGAELGGTDTRPVITNVELIQGTIFQGAGFTPTPVAAWPLASYSTVDSFATVPNPTVAVDGIIALVTFDISGIDPGSSFQLLLAGIEVEGMTFSTDFYTPGQGYVGNSIIVNGTLHVVPEPGTMAMLGVLAVAMMGVVIRRRRAA